MSLLRPCFIFRTFIIFCSYSPSIANMNTKYQRHSSFIDIKGQRGKRKMRFLMEDRKLYDGDLINIRMKIFPPGLLI